MSTFAGNDGTQYNWWNWIFIIPLDAFLAAIWPIYWVLQAFA